MTNYHFRVFLGAWNDTQNLDTPAHHFRIAEWIEEKFRSEQRKLLLMAFRNSGKSTLAGIFVAWLLHCDPALRIIVLSADHALAARMVRNVKRIIEHHPMTQALKPPRPDQWAADRFTVRRERELRDPSVLAKGIGANITGSRADIVICDDVEVPNTCDSAGKREDLRQRLADIDFVLEPAGTQLFIGTPHTYFTIYADSVRAEVDESAPFLAGFERLEIPLLDEAGKSQWPERFSQEVIDALRLKSGPNRFGSQMMLKAVNVAEGRLDPELLRVYDEELVYAESNREARLTLRGRRLVSASCWWGPAYGAPGSGDASVIAVVYTDEQGTYWLHGIEYLVHDPGLVAKVDEATQLCRKVVRFLRKHHLPAVRLETNGLGRFLPGLLRREIVKAGLNCSVIEEVSRHTKSKRILNAFDAVLSAGRLHAHRCVWDTAFVMEMREWRPGAGGRDDGLDAVSGCLLNEPVRLPRVPSEPSDRRPRPSWRVTEGSFRANTGFEI